MNLESEKLHIYKIKNWLNYTMTRTILGTIFETLNEQLLYCQHIGVKLIDNIALLEVINTL